MHRNPPTTSQIISHLCLVLLLTSVCFAVPAVGPEAEGGESENIVRLFKLRLSDLDGKPLANLVVPEGEMGLYYERAGDKAIGLLPKTDGEDKVEIAVFQVSRVAEEDEDAVLFKVLPPMIAGDSEAVRLAEVGDFQVRVIGTKTVRLPADSAN